MILAGMSIVVLVGRKKAQEKLSPRGGFDFSIVLARRCYAILSF
jgi:hypothetical protein